MKCPKCQFENPENMQFCGRCGSKLANICPRCEFVNPPGFQFCGKCGASLTEEAPPSVTIPRLEDMHTQLQRFIPQSLAERMYLAEREMEGENRLVTALFADISGFTPMSRGLTPEATVDKVNQCFQTVTDAVYRYEGSINRFIGDCVLAFFGAPLAHENDPERAILAALDMRDAVSQLGLSISVGINTGMMYFGPIGTQEHLEISAYGTDINLAKRLQETAQPGQIMVGEGTYRFTRRAFEFEHLEHLTLKGIAEPVSAYAALKLLPKPEKIRGIEGLRAELIGRDEELTKLKDALMDVLGGRGQMVSLIGEAGVGKSRLVAELKEFALHPAAHVGTRHAVSLRPPSTSLWLEGRCLSLGMTASYWPFIDIFRDYFAWGADESDRARGESIVARLRELVEQGDLSEDRLEEIGPLLGHLLSVQFGNDWDERLKNATPEQIRHQTFMAIRDIFLALCRRQPVILVFEDLHWGDSLSLDLISLLMETLTLAPLFLLCVYRPEHEHKSWHLATIASQKCPERYTELHLRELTPQQSRRLVESLLTIDRLPASVKEMILEKSQGNPFFVEEVVRSLIDAGMVYREEDVWRAREGIESVTVPESIQSIILSRVDRLEQELRYVLQSASVVGRLFRRRLLERVTQQETELERDLWQLEDHELIYQERIVPEEEYSFKHVLTQETVYQNILERRRAAFHQQVAEAMEILYQDALDEYYEQLAYHYDKSGSVEKAVEYLLKAGEKSRRAYLNDEAIGYFQRALERLDGSPLGESRKDWRLEALNGLALTYHGIGKGPEAEEYLRHAIALGQEIGLAPRKLVQFYHWLGEVLYWQSRYDELIPLAEEGLALLGDDTESVEAVLMKDRIAVAYISKGDSEKYREFVHQNAQFIQRLPYSEELRPVYAHIFEVYAFYDKNIDEGLKWLKAFRSLAQQHHHLTALGSVHNYTGSITADRGDLRGAILHTQQGLELWMKIGDAKHESRCLGSLIGTFLSLGNLQKAEEYIYRRLELIESMGYKRDIGESYMSIGMISLCQGSLEKATDAFQKAVQLFREINFRGTARATLSLARAYLAQEKRQEALSQFQEAIVQAKPDSLEFAGALSGLEEAYDDSEEFRAFCRRFREEHPVGARHDVPSWPLIQWYLEPAEVCDLPQTLVHDDFVGTRHDVSLPPEWVWQDEFDDCSFTVQNGLEIHAANGRDLWRINLSAPRILREVSGDFAAQTVCVPVSEEKPAIGGILLWKDKENFLRLDKGTRGEHEISFEGCLGNEDVTIGRGRLPSVGAGSQPAQRVFLRLERLGDRVNALCSADGVEWFTVGHAEFPADDPVEVGLHAISNIDRTIYHGAYPNGTAIRFESFQLCAR